MMLPKVAALQMISGPDLAENLQQAQALIIEAVAAGARLLVLPEFFPIMGMNEQQKLALAEEEGGGPIQTFLSGMARQHGVWLVGGAIPLRATVADKVRNSCLVFDKLGQQVARYDKVHLFSFDNGQESYDEAQTIEPGGGIVTFDSPFGRIGLAICYDLRFPEMFRAMHDIDILVVSAAFTYTTGSAHWELLLRARAVENLVYVIASAQGGHHPNGRRTYGHSMVIDPWGKVLQVLPEGAGIVMAELDCVYQQQLRRNLPVLKHRKF